MFPRRGIVRRLMIAMANGWGMDTKNLARRFLGSSYNTKRITAKTTKKKNTNTPRQEIKLRPSRKKKRRNIENYQEAEVLEKNFFFLLLQEKRIT